MIYTFFTSRIFILSLIALFSRILYIRYFKRRFKCKGPISRVKTAIVIGSGGHTSEMLRQVQSLRPHLYSPRLYIMALSDTNSESKIIDTESAFKSSVKDFSIAKIHRSRHVNQSYFTSIFTTLYSTFTSIPLLFNFKPQLILCNGPGTCIPVCFIVYLMNLFFFADCTIVFIESICRVQTLSLSGKIMRFFADEIIVQWPQLKKNYSGVKYLGQIL